MLTSVQDDYSSLKFETSKSGNNITGHLSLCGSKYTPHSDPGPLDGEHFQAWDAALQNILSMPHAERETNNNFHSMPLSSW